ncbi:MAG: serine/threonine protein kinase [Nitrospira sp.]|nr:MAG: serine/threonine protein kinase [Nitrospira sp.]
MTHNIDHAPHQNNDHFFLSHLQSVEGDQAWYYNQKFLGRGGNGTAFLVTCTSEANYGMQFVLKVFHKISDPIRRNAFLKEIEHLRSLNHPAITRIFDEGMYRAATGIEYPFAVIEYVPITARQLLVSRELDRLRAIRIALNCLSALDCLHTATPPLIHRDIKPENILISDVGAKLADFGLVKALDDLADEHEADALNGTQIPGMPFRYRTPELVQRVTDSGIQITPASDIYQFGTVFYELLTGFNPQRKPEKLSDPIDLDLRDIRGGEGVHLTRLIGHMLADIPGNRPSAHDCLVGLNGIHRAYCEALANVTGQFG